MLVQLRGIWYSLRKREYGNFTYISCDIHSSPLCAIVLGTHISIEEIGMNVKIMQKTVAELLFSSSGIFSCFGDLHEFRGMTDEVFDKKQNKSVGYWFGKEEKIKIL